MIEPISFTGRLQTRPKYTETYDSFTGLKDKKSLLHDVQKKMMKKDDISVGMLDMDNFKSVNELLGYKTGDEFIKTISEDISEVSKDNKVDAYRFGGDEFVVLLFDKAPKEEKLGVVKSIIDKVQQNPKINNKSKEYKENGNKMLSQYEKDNQKVKDIITVNTRHDILHEIYDNGTLAKQDPYVQTSIEQTDKKRIDTYNSILQESIDTENDTGLKESLKIFKSDIDNKQKEADEYIFDRYDKNHEIYRIKKWMKDFDKNGFSMTGGVADFTPEHYKKKQPIDLINEAGEVLKNGKSTAKGQIHYQQFKTT